MITDEQKAKISAAILSAKAMGLKIKPIGWGVNPTRGYWYSEYGCLCALSCVILGSKVDPDWTYPADAVAIALNANMDEVGSFISGFDDSVSVMGEPVLQSWRDFGYEMRVKYAEVGV